MEKNTQEHRNTKGIQTTEQGDNTVSEKHELRLHAKLVRHKAWLADPDAGEKLLPFVSDIEGLEVGKIIAGYWPMADEIDPRPLMRALVAKGCQLTLPGFQQDTRDKTLIFREYAVGDVLEQGRYGLHVPSDTAAPLLPDILLVPLLAFDRRGHRLGYGGGYYDRVLEALGKKHKVTAIGLAFAEQEVENLPDEPWDHLLHAVITPKGISVF